MNLSARSLYAALASIELAIQNASGTPVQIRLISERHNIPSRFLVQIMLQLKGAGIVSSTRGAAGGYQLSREPSEVSLLQVIEAVETTGESNAETSSGPERTVLQRIWQQASEAQRQVLRETTLEKLVHQMGDRSDPMYFI